MAGTATELTLQIATPMGVAMHETAQGVEIPSAAGQLGVLAGHVPLLAALRPGVLTYHKDGKATRAAIGGGFVEAGPDSVRLITEFFVSAEKVDLDAATKDRQDAEKRLKEFAGDFGDMVRVEAQRDLDWALARIQLANSSSN